MLVDQGFWEATCLGTNPESPYTIINNDHHSNNNHLDIGRAILHKYKSPHFIEPEQKEQGNILKLLTHCQKCTNPFIQPVTLPCGFTKCYKCLSPKEQCLSFSCLRTHLVVSHLKPTVLLERILHQYYNHDKMIERSLLNCSICLSTLQEPVTTECGHTFCKECLLRTMTELNKKACPYCRTELSRIGKTNQIISGWIDYLSSSSEEEEEEYQQQDSNAIPLIQVTSAIAFPTQPCLIHISQDTSLLLKNMIQQHPFKQPYYAICVISNNQNDFFEYGIMLQIHHVEHLPDIRHSVIQAQGLFRLKIHHLLLDTLDNCYTGHVTRFDDVQTEEMYMDRQQWIEQQTKLKRWTLPPSTITPSQTTPPLLKHRVVSSVAAAAAAGGSPRPRPFSMRLSSSAPNNYSLSTTTLENYPGSSSRRTWGTMMQSMNNKTPNSSPPPPLPPSASIAIKKPKIPSRTNSSSTVSSTASGSPLASSTISNTGTTTLDNLYNQELHPYVVHYLQQENNLYLLQQYQVKLQQESKTALVWWLAAHILPLDYNEKIHLLSTETLRERIMTLIIWAHDKWKPSSSSSPPTSL